MRILVTPERLRELAHLFQQAQIEWRDQGSHLLAQYNGLDWEARQRVNIEGQVEQATRMSNELAQRAEELATSLERTAARFEQADREGAVALGASIGGATSTWLQGLSSLPPSLQLSSGKFSSWEQLSTLLGAPLEGVVSLPVSGGNALVGLSLLASLPWLGGPLQGVADTIWNWLHGYGWRNNTELLSPFPSTSEPEIPKGMLRDTIIQDMEKQASPSANPSVTSSSPVIESQKAEDSALPAQTIDDSVPTLSQQGLKYNGKNTEYGCTAASTSMVLEYWHKKDSAVGTLSAQEILDANAKQGTFNGKGLSITEVHDEVKGLGYSVMDDRVNADFETLKQDVQQGPVVAVVKLGITKSGYNHAVVVTSISEDGNVVINDPWDGQSHTYTAKKFQSSWGADFGGGLKNMYSVIRP